MKRFRRICLVWHRYAGLTMALFLAIAALTGSLLAFMDPIQRFVAPQLYAKPQPGVPKLDLPTLAERAQGLLPHAEVNGVMFSEPDQVQVNFTPKKDPATKRPYNLGFTQFYIDPWTGKELAHRNRRDISDGWINLMPWMTQLHDKLLLGPGGFLFMGIIALIWTIDCFVALYLTLPPVLRAFWHHWKPSWLIKTNAKAYRINLDLHRAFGLWLWPIVFIFAWSSVGLNIGFVQGAVMNALFGKTDNSEVRKDMAKMMAFKPKPALGAPDWRRLLTDGQRLYAEEAGKKCLTVGEPKGISYSRGVGTYQVDVGRGDPAMVMFDPATGERLATLVMNPHRNTGATLSYWFQKLHLSHSFGPVYETFVAFLGLVITMFSVTGVYLWWKKRSFRRAQVQTGLATDETVPNSVVQSS